MTTGMYLILKELADHRLPSTTSAMWADPAPPPFPVPPSTTGRYLEESASEPTFGLSGQMMARRAPMPLWCSQKKIPTSTHAPLTKAASAPCVGCRNNVPLLPGPSSANNIWCFMALIRATRDCLWRLCCCVRVPNRQALPLTNNRVASLKEAGGGGAQEGIPEWEPFTCL